MSDLQYTNLEYNISIRQPNEPCVQFNTQWGWVNNLSFTLSVDKAVDERAALVSFFKELEVAPAFNLAGNEHAANSHRCTFRSIADLLAVSPLSEKLRLNLNVPFVKQVPDTAGNGNNLHTYEMEVCIDAVVSTAQVSADA